MLLYNITTNDNEFFIVFSLLIFSRLISADYYYFSTDYFIFNQVDF